MLVEKFCASLESGESQGFFAEEMDTLEIDNKSIAVNNADYIQVGAGQFHQQVSKFLPNTFTIGLH